MIIDSGVITGSLQVSGSLAVTGSSNLQGDVKITGSLSVSGPISGAITGSITNAVSASYALNASTADSATSASRATSAASADTATSASRATSAANADNATSASFATTAATAISAPYYVLTASYNTDSSSLSTRTTNLESTASTLTTASASFATVSASYSVASGSLSTRVTTIETSYATTGSNTFTGNNVFGNITGSNAKFNTASIEYLNVIYQTSSIVYSSGSNQFGDASVDVQTLFGTVDVKTGPVLVTGSLNVSGGITGSLNGSNLVAASVANAKLTNSTISGVALGSNLGTLTISTGLSGTSYNGSTGVTIANTGVLSVTTNTGLSTNASATGNVTITNTGVTSITAGTGISRDVSTGGVTITNTGVTSNVAGTGISVSGGTGAVTITNTGVTSAVAGTGVGVSAGTGAVTISIGQAVGTGANVQFNSLGVGTAGSGTTGEIRATADVTAFYSSDERLKENITPIENPIEKLMAINGVTFDWKEGFDEVHSHKGADTGVIAQQIEAIGLPETVTTRENGFKAVKYEKLNALLIEGFKAQQKEINELKELVHTLLNK